MLKDDVESLEDGVFEEQFILTPLDDLFLYLRDRVLAQWRMGVCYVIFDGTEMVGAFKARKRGARLEITAFEGNGSAKNILDRFESENELTVGEERSRITDEEVMRWYELMYSKGSNK